MAKYFTLGIVICDCCVLGGGGVGAKGIYLEVSSANRIVVPSTFYEGLNTHAHAISSKYQYYEFQLIRGIYMWGGRGGQYELV